MIWFLKPSDLYVILTASLSTAWVSSISAT